MGTEFAIDTHNFVVTFDPSSSTPISITGETFPVHIARGISLITFTLEPGDAGAQFPSNPMQWFDGSRPVFSPHWFLCHHIDNLHFSLWDFNSAPIATSHQFELSVFANGTIFTTTDPIFINDPPAQPPPVDEY